jgi:hypothetical protein
MRTTVVCLTLSAILWVGLARGRSWLDGVLGGQVARDRPRGAVLSSRPAQSRRLPSLFREEPSESGLTARLVKVGRAHLPAIPKGTPSLISRMQHSVDSAVSARSLQPAQKSASTAITFAADIVQPLR